MNQYLHKEAFCEMSYVCEKCGTGERLWNSRDGVTPFMIGCSKQNCDGLMQHVNFWDDLVVFEPRVSRGVNRCFVDMTLDKAKQLAEQRFEKFGQQMMEQYPHLKEMGKEKLIESSVENFYQEGRAPYIIPVKDWLAQNGEMKS